MRVLVTATSRYGSTAERGIARTGLVVFRSIEGGFRNRRGIKNWAESIAEQLLAADGGTIPVPVVSSPPLRPGGDR